MADSFRGCINWFLIILQKKFNQIAQKLSIMSAFIDRKLKPCCYPAFRCCCSWPQVGQHPGRRVFAAAFALCGWTVSPWTWRREQRSPQGSRPVVQATAAATAHSVRTRDTVWREPTASPVTVAHLLILEPSVRQVRTNCPSSSSNASAWCSRT